MFLTPTNRSFSTNTLVLPLRWSVGCGRCSLGMHQHCIIAEQSGGVGVCMKVPLSDGCSVKQTQLPIERGEVMKWLSAVSDLHVGNPCIIWFGCCCSEMKPCCAEWKSVTLLIPMIYRLNFCQYFTLTAMYWMYEINVHLKSKPGNCYYREAKQSSVINPLSSRLP